jgi:hypothetical protein
MPHMDNATATKLDLDAIPGEPMRRLYRYWQSKCDAHAMPARADIDPVDFPWALGNVCLIELEREPPRLRYRLVGTRLLRPADADLTGRFVDDIPSPELRELVRRHLTEAAATAAPNLYRMTVTNEYGPHGYVRLALPLRGADGKVAMILTMAEPVGPHGAGDLLSPGHHRPAML